MVNVSQFTTRSQDFTWKVQAVLIVACVTVSLAGVQRRKLHRNFAACFCSFVANKFSSARQTELTCEKRVSSGRLEPYTRSEHHYYFYYYYYYYFLLLLFFSSPALTYSVVHCCLEENFNCISRLVFTSNWARVGVVIRSVELYDLVILLIPLTTLSFTIKWKVGCRSRKQKRKN